MLFLFVLTSPSYAYNYRQEVLAASDQNLNIPPTTGGPGLILPDSPLFFLDQIKQQVRLLSALTSEDKAKVHQQIAEERLAELRIMLTKKNDTAIKTSLDGVTQNLKLAAEDLNNAKLTGRDVSKLAKSLNDDIKTKQESLDVLESEASGELGTRVEAATQGLTEAKVKVEDHLAPQDLDSAVKEDLHRKTKKDLHNLNESNDEIRNTIQDLVEEASDSAKKSLEHRQEALKKAIELRNETLKKSLEKQIEKEKKESEKSLELKKKVLEDISKTTEQLKQSMTDVANVSNGSKDQEKNQNTSSGSPQQTAAPAPASPTTSNSGSGSSGGSGGSGDSGRHGGDDNK